VSIKLERLKIHEKEERPQSNALFIHRQPTAHLDILLLDVLRPLLRLPDALVVLRRVPRFLVDFEVVENCSGDSAVVRWDDLNGVRPVDLRMRKG
jgi:hypothetical protein